MKRIGYIIIEYSYELLAIVIFILGVISDSAQQGKISISCIAINVVGIMILYLVLWGLAYLAPVICKPLKCRLLHISQKNEIHMNTIYMDTEKRKKLFFEEFENIIEFAKKNNRNPLKIRTHEIVLLGMLCNYMGVKKREAFTICESMLIGEEKKCKMSFGSTKIKRLPDGINTSARFEYKRIMKPSQIKKTISDVKLYEIEIMLDK